MIGGQRSKYVGCWIKGRYGQNEGKHIYTVIVRVEGSENTAD